MKRLKPENIEEIKKLRKDGYSLTLIAEKIGFSKSIVSVYSKGITIDKVISREHLIEKVKPINIKKLDLSKTDIGEASRQLICARLMFNGLSVFKPITEDTPVDLLLINKNNKILRCQCKFIYLNKNGGHTLLFCTVRKNNVSKKAKVHVYTDKDVDFIIGYCIDNDSLYIVPIKEVNNRRSVTLWLLREPTGRSQYEHFDYKKYENRYELLLNF